MDFMQEQDAYLLGRDVTAVLAMVSVLAQSKAGKDLWAVLLGMLKDYRHRVHARGLAELEDDTEDPTE